MYKVKLLDKDGNEVNRITVHTLEDANDFLPVGGSYEDLTDYSKQRREHRKEIFSKTLDKMTPPWYQTLTEDQKERLSAFRQAYLDYPSTGVIPDKIVKEELNSETQEIVIVEVSTDISDIF